MVQRPMPETCWHCGDELPDWVFMPTAVAADGALVCSTEPPWLLSGFCSEECGIEFEEEKDDTS